MDINVDLTSIVAEICSYDVSHDQIEAKIAQLVSQGRIPNFPCETCNNCPTPRL